MPAKQLSRIWFDKLQEGTNEYNHYQPMHNKTMRVFHGMYFAHK